MFRVFFVSIHIFIWAIILTGVVMAFWNALYFHSSALKEKNRLVLLLRNWFVEIVFAYTLFYWFTQVFFFVLLNFVSFPIVLGYFGFDVIGCVIVQRKFSALFNRDRLH